MAKAFLRHAVQAGHCEKARLRWMKVYGISIEQVSGPNAPGIDTDYLRSLSSRFNRLCDIAEQEEAERG